MIKLLKKNKCDICQFDLNGNENKLKSQIYFDKHTLKYSIDICDRCGHIFSKNISNYNPYETDVEKYYNRQHNDENEIPTDPFRNRQTKEILNIAGNRKSLNYVEIGSSDGLLFRNIRKQYKGELKAVLIEVSGASNHLQSKKVEVINKSIYEIDKIKFKAEVMVLSHSLEHFFNLNNVFEFIKSNISKNGTLYIEVPDGLRYDQSLSYPLGYFHVHNFTDITLVILLERIGCKIIDVQMRDDYPGLRVISQFNETSNILDMEKIFNFSKIRATSWWEKILNRRKSLLEKLKERINDNDTKILVYGAGTHTISIFDYFTKWKTNDNIQIADMNWEKIEKFLGKKVMNPNNIDYSIYDLVIISSYAYQKDILNFIISKGVDKDNIVKFYSNIFSYNI